jgi:diketogulonate reductase-like aldo/keto reductase
MSRPLSRRLLLGVSASAALAACRAQHGPTSSSAPQEGQVPLPPPSASTLEMPTRVLGKTGVKVSRVGLGGAHIGKQSDEQDSIRIVRSAIDRGLTFMDNAWDYNDGHSEERMGRALRDGYRQRAFLMTKLDGRTKQSAAAQLEQSLRRLQTDTIDLVQVHEVIRFEDPARVFGANGAMEALMEARKAGKLRFIGFTGHKDPAIHLAMLKAADDHGFEFDTIQMPLNVMDAHYKSFEHQVLPVAVQRGMGILHMKPLGGGFILDSKTVTAVECLNYAMNLPTSVMITGCDSLGVLDQAIAAALAFQPLSPSEVASLLARTAQAASSGKFELFKSSEYFDSTAKHPRWLEEARI